MIMAKKKRNKNLIIIVSIVVVLLVLVAITSFLAYNNIQGYYEYEASVKVGDYVGINLDTDKIHFGTVFAGGHSKREVFVNTTTPGYVFLTVSGPMKNMIQTFDRFSNVQEGEQKSFVLYAAPPHDSEDGVYNSTVHVYVLKHKCALLEMFLKGKPVEVLGEYDIVGDSGAKIMLEIAPPNEQNSS